MDLREYIKSLQLIDELWVVENAVNAGFNASAAVARAMEEDGKGLLLEEIREFPNFSFVGGIFSRPSLWLHPKKKYPDREAWSKYASILQASEDISLTELLNEIQTRKGEKIFANEVNTGPCEEVTISQEELDLTNIPIPKPTQYDEREYLPSAVLILQDPETGDTKWIETRIIRFDKRRFILPVSGNPKMAGIYSKYAEKEEDIPSTLLIGPEPAVTIVAKMGVPTGMAGIAGSLQKKPVELMEGKKNELMIPVNTEVVIEGVIKTYEMEEKGTHQGFFRKHESEKEPVFEAKYIMRRENPIIPIDVPPLKMSDQMVLTSLIHSQELLEAINGLYSHNPAVWVHVPPELRLGIGLVAAKVDYPGQMGELGKLMLGNSPYITFAGVLDEEEYDGCIVEALNSCFRKTSPDKWEFLSEMRTPESMRIKSSQKTSTRVYLKGAFDPTWKDEWISQRISFEDNIPFDIQKKVVEKWKEWEFAKDPIWRKDYAKKVREVGVKE